MFASRRRCPGCGVAKRITIERKWLVSKLCECPDCGLRFRVPTQDERETAAFYAASYEQGFTTALPSRAELDVMMTTGFSETDRSYITVVEFLRAVALTSNPTVMDYGCSWGYGSWQLAQAGFDVSACELDERRAAFARRELGINVIPLAAVPDGTFDIFFSAHVIEHMTNPRAFVEQGMRALKPGGIFVAVTPNGSEEYRVAQPTAYHRLWGRVHPQLITPAWVAHVAGSRPFVVGSLPWRAGACDGWQNKQTTMVDGSSQELAFAMVND